MKMIRRKTLFALAMTGALTVAAGTARAQTAAPTPPSPSAAAPAAMTLAQVEAMVTNMGYTVKPSTDGKTFTALIAGQLDLTMTFNVVSSDGSVLVYVFLQRYDPAQLARLNAVRFLEQNDIWLSYFSLSKVGDDRSLYLQRDIAAPAVTPQTLRVAITEIQKITATTESDWSMPKWTPPAPP